MTKNRRNLRNPINRKKLVEQFRRTEKLPGTKVAKGPLSKNQTLHPEKLRSATNRNIQLLAQENFTLVPGKGGVRQQDNILLKDAARGLTFRGEAFQDSDEFQNLLEAERDPNHPAFENAFRMFFKNVMIPVGNLIAKLYYDQLDKTYSQKIWNQFYQAMIRSIWEGTIPEGSKNESIKFDPQPTWQADFYFSNDNELHVRTKLSDFHLIHSKFNEENGNFDEIEKYTIPGEIEADLILTDKGFVLEWVHPTNPALNAFIHEDKIAVKTALARQPLELEIEALEKVVHKNRPAFNFMAEIIDKMYQFIDNANHPLDYQDEVKIRPFIAALVEYESNYNSIENIAILETAFNTLPDSLRNAVRKPTETILIALINTSLKPYSLALDAALQRIDEKNVFSFSKDLLQHAKDIDTQITALISQSHGPLSAEVVIALREIASSCTVLLEHPRDEAARNQLQKALKTLPADLSVLKKSAQTFLYKLYEHIFERSPIVVQEGALKVSRQPAEPAVAKLTDYVKTQLAARDKDQEKFVDIKDVLDAGSGYVSRFFNEFKGLYPTAIPLVDTINEVITADLNTLLPDGNPSTRHMEAWLDFQKATAANDLFDKSGRIRPELYEILNQDKVLDKLIFIFGEDEIKQKLLSSYVGLFIGTHAYAKVSEITDPAQALDEHSPITHYNKITRSRRLNGEIEPIDQKFMSNLEGNLLAITNKRSIQAPTLKTKIADYVSEKKLDRLILLAKTSKDDELKSVVFELVKLARNPKNVAMLLEVMPIVERFYRDPEAHARELDAKIRKISSQYKYTLLSEKLVNLQFASANRVLRDTIQDPNVSDNLKTPAQLVMRAIEDLDAKSLSSNKLLLTKALFQTNTLIIKSSRPDTNVNEFNNHLKAYGELMKQVTEPKPLQKVAGAMLCVAGAVLMLSPLVIFATLGPLGILAAPLAKIGMTAMVAGLATLGLTGAPMVARGGYSFFQSKVEGDAKSPVKNKMGSFMKESAQSYRDAHRKDDAEDKNNKPKR